MIRYFSHRANMGRYRQKTPCMGGSRRYI